MSEAFKKFTRLLVAGTENNTQAFYDQYIEKNARFRSEAGLKTVIVRDSGGKCCDWCADLDGTYTYEDAPKDVFARHANCNCTVTCRTTKGTWQDAWSKKEYSSLREARIARAEEIAEKEQSNKRRKALNQKTLADFNKLLSSDFRKNVSLLDENVKVNRELFLKMKDILTHRSGTEFEDLAFINSTNGKGLINKSFDKKRCCIPSKKMKSLLETSDQHSIIGLHNHPYSSPPSWDDIMVAQQRKYKYGVVIGHNATIYKYSITDDFNSTNVSIYIDKLNRIFYNQGVDLKDFAEIVHALADNGLILEVF